MHAFKYEVSFKPGSHQRHKHKIDTKTKHDLSSWTCKYKTTRICLCFVFCSALGLCFDYVLMLMLRLCSYACAYVILYVAGLTAFLCFAFCLSLCLCRQCEPAGLIIKVGNKGGLYKRWGEARSCKDDHLRNAFLEKCTIFLRRKLRRKIITFFMPSIIEERNFYL